MRETDSNFRGLRSESGTRMENSVSSSATRSVKLKESRSPDSKSDSSGSISIFLPATRRTISTIRACLSMGNLIGFQSGFLVDFVLRHKVLKQSGRQPLVAAT